MRSTPSASATPRWDRDPRTRAAFALGPHEQDQVHRLAAFRAARPGVEIREGAGYWQARIAEENVETVITRYTLGDLLDKLDSLSAPGGPGA
jgi:hypothetical protein